MANLVIDYLEKTVETYSTKSAFVDNQHDITFEELHSESFKVASLLIKKKYFKQPILIFLEKSVYSIISFVGVAYSGNFYSPIDIKMPIDRIRKVIDTLNPVAIITDNKHRSDVQQFSEGAEIFTIENMVSFSDYDKTLVLERSEKIIDTDILYVLFTSGSTGVPKGVIINHRSVVDYIDWICNKFNLDDSTILGNQAQLYFDLSIQDVYVPLKTGATTVLIENRTFIQPVKVWNILLKYQVNTLVWIPSMLSMFANLDILTNVKPASLNIVMFCGEVMPMKQLNYWIRNYPKVTFVNLYGPTECTDACTYYIIDREFSDDDVLPIGKACENSEAFIVDEQGNLVAQVDIIGELYMRGSALSMGYYNDPEKTKDVFVQNPVNTSYPEIVYRTGDLVRYNEYHELVYVSRKDFQIKHRGFRIELGEIEAAAAAIPEIECCCCLFHTEQDKLILVYTGDVDPSDIKKDLALKLQEYMLPVEYYKRDTMLFNMNGKIDRKKLENIYCC